MFKTFKFLYSPDTPPAVNPPSPPNSGMSDLDILNSADTNVESKEEPTTEEPLDFSFEGLDKVGDDDESEAEGIDENKEVSEEETEVKEEGVSEDEAKALESRPTLTDIKAKYPNIFKEYPDLKHVLFREAAYSEVFSTVKEAKIAAGRAETLGRVEEALFDKADAQGLFEVVAKQDKKAFETLAANILPAISQVDQTVYLEILKPVFKLLARSMYANGTKNGNESLKNSALHLHDYVFQNSELDQEYDTKYSKKQNPEAEEISKKHEEFENRQLGLAIKDINGRLVKRLSKSVEASLANIGEGVSDYMKEVIANKTVDKVFEALKADQSFGRMISGLIPELRKTGYSEDSKVRIITAYLTRAKSLIPNIRKEELTKALGGKIVAKDKEVKKPPTRVIPSGQTGRPSSTQGKKPDWKVVPKGREGEIAILSGKY